MGVIEKARALGEKSQREGFDFIPAYDPDLIHLIRLNSEQSPPGRDDARPILVAYQQGYILSLLNQKESHDA